jgi:hypothetical protein
VPAPRSDLVRRVLGSLRDHPHDDTIERVTTRLGLVDADAVQAALAVLEQDRLVNAAGGHWQLTQSGWRLARADDNGAES